MAGSEAEWITVANNLLLKCHIHLRIRELEDCDANVFIALYQSILGEKTGQSFKESHQGELLEEPESTKGSRSSWKRVSFERCSLSSEALGPSWDGDETESTGEIIRLGDTAHTFSLRSNGAKGPNEMQSKKASTISYEEVPHPPLPSFLSKNRTSFVEDMEIPSVDVIPSARKLGEPIQSAIPLHPPYHPSEPRAPCPIGKEYLRSSHISSAMNSTGEGTAFSVVSGKACLQLGRMQQSPMYIVSEKCAFDNSVQSMVLLVENKAVSQRPRKRLTEQELHSVSKKLSQRLSELDWMLKSALGDRIKEKTDYEEDDIGNEEMESRKDETLSQHSDSIMEYGPKNRRPGLSTRRRPPCRSHSLSPSPLNKNTQFHKERKRQRKPKETDIRQFQAKAITEAFERELRRNKVQENIGSLGINEEEETEKIYREAVHKGTPKRSQPWKTYSRKTTTPSPRGGLPKPNKAVPMKVNEHSLLPLMLEQFPFLYVSGQTLSKMWKQQITQVEQLKKDAYRENQSKKKLQDEIEEALKRHDLLTALVKKEYEHSKRLQDFKDRIHRQKLTQSKIIENRQQIVRARKYYDDYRVQLRAKMMRMRTREEMIFKKLFEEGTLYKVKRELRSKMEKEIQQLQHMITQNDDDSFFRELEAERFRALLHLASFQYSKNPFL
ncbi:centrosomal protein of 95 kDa [Leptonychotes weddellii]|uniref:Centrosomal protein of 95 kDa n=1 Tax=Leptonychotes weddellii TaxID=9713 RepID=A0A7F8R5B5_LEPWE|nr:centrosomal protein of 95 kDa [Leptonychotes weddellii]